MPALAQGIDLNKDNISVPVGPGTSPGSFDSTFANGATIGKAIDFRTACDISTLHFWNYDGEGYDVDKLDFVFFDAANRQVGTLGIVPALGSSPAIFAQDIPLAAPLNVRCVTAFLRGSNREVDFQNIGFTASASVVPEPMALAARPVSSGTVRGLRPPDAMGTTMKTSERDALLRTLEQRFQAHPHRHRGVAWADVLARLAQHPSAMQTLAAMESSGGEPDVIGRDPASGQISFCDCSAESPAGRRSLCFDGAALDARKENKPAGSALQMAAAMGVQLLTEDEYRALQVLGEFDTKTSSWVQTPADMRALGGALFCDRRYGRVFTYHNGAQSYYAVRGFRGVLRV